MATAPVVYLLLLPLATNLPLVCGQDNWDNWFKYERERTRARQWLLDQRSGWNWGEETPRAMVALALSRSSPGKNITADLEYDVLQREFKLMLAGKILLENLSFLETESQMLWIHGMLATCTNPSHFYGRNVLNNLETAKKPDWNNFYFYLVLCTSKSKRLDSRYVSSLVTRIIEEAGKSPLITESLAMALLLLKCIHNQHPHLRHLPDISQKGLQKLLDIQEEDGGYGFIYTTALALQALLAYNARDASLSHQDAIEKAYRNIMKQQNASTGAFRDLIGTHLVLPALAGRTLVDLANMSCNLTGEKEENQISRDRRLSLHVEYDDINLTINLKALRNSSILDILNIAASKHHAFTFEKVTINSATYIYSICGKINDPQKGWSWSASLALRVPTHIKQEKSISHLEDIATYVPSGSYHSLIYRYRKR